jgi:hypothetical protein
MQQVLGMSQLNNHLGIALIPNDRVFDQKMVVFAYNRFDHFAVLQSSLHYVWVWEYGTKNLSLVNYSPTTCFETFPPPEDFLGEVTIQSLVVIGKAYYDLRQQIMEQRDMGFTKLYNSYHDPAETSAEIEKLRRQHVEMDQAVALAYGWNDLDLGHGFHETKQGRRYTISEAVRRIVLDRLLALNHQRYAEEIEAGLHDETKAKGKGRSRKADAAEPNLFL